jgi:adenosylcobinamide-GDP ribazoletransferase
MDVGRADLGASLWAFPAAGLIVGGLSAAAFMAFYVTLPSAQTVTRALASAAAAVSMTVLVTGGLHLDGLADTADGLAGGRDRDTTLAIMRDSRIGSAGAVWTGLDLITRIAIISGMNDRNIIPWLCLAAGCGRFAQSLAILAFPYARESGLGSAFALGARPVHVLVGAACIVPIAAAGGIPRAVAAAIAIAAGALFAGQMSRRLTGLTGDVYGALSELVEISVLVTGALLTGGTFA